MKDLALYIHIPFCMKKCDYCDFLSLPGGGRIQQQYVEALVHEISSYQALRERFCIRTVFFGGGTPSILADGMIEEILAAAEAVFGLKEAIEITVECNPGTLTPGKLEGYRRAGVNRLSMGLQSADNEELKLLGRIHTYEEFVLNYRMAAELGFDNINVDLMSALPGQTYQSWCNSLLQVISLGASHISAYSLIIEEGTPFYSRYGEGKGSLLLPGEEEERRMYHETGGLLRAAGYKQYEISNYAKPGCECVHNCAYWTGIDYLGLGLGASSYLDGVRFRNEERLENYIKDAGKQDMAKEKEVLTREERMEEFMFLGLRMADGVSKKDFCQRFGTEIDEVYGLKIERLSEEGLLDSNQDRLLLTPRGIDVSNRVFVEFLL